MTPPAKNAPFPRKGITKKESTNNDNEKDNIFLKIWKLILFAIRLFVNLIKWFAHAPLRLIHYDSKRHFKDVSICLIAVALLPPIAIAFAANSMLSVSRLGFWYAVGVMIYKFLVAEIGYVSYANKFCDKDGNKVAPPANPHQFWRVIFVVLCTVTIGVIFLHFQHPKDITWNTIYIVVGFLSVILGCLQDIISGLVSVFEAQYPSRQPVKYMKG